jgi:hypothetical protein
VRDTTQRWLCERVVLAAIIATVIGFMIAANPNRRDG